MNFCFFYYIQFFFTFARFFKIKITVNQLPTSKYHAPNVYDQHVSLSQELVMRGGGG